MSKSEYIITPLSWVINERGIALREKVKVEQTKTGRKLDYIVEENQGLITQLDNIILKLRQGTGTNNKIVVELDMTMENIVSTL